MMNVGGNAKNYVIGVLEKIIMSGILASVIVICKNFEYVNIEKCFC